MEQAGLTMMKRATDDDVVHHFGGNTYAKQYVLRAGQTVVQHRHNFDHLSVLASGTVQMHVDGETHELIGPACITIAAHKHHGIRALTDVTWFCIHAVSDEDLTEECDRVEAQGVANALGMGMLS